MKSTKRQINAALSKLLGIKLYSIRAHGREDVTDISNTGHQISTIFDVGANTGQSATKFREAFPSSTIYCFEPVRYIYEKLKKRTSNDKNTKPFPLALGKATGRATIFLTDHETTSSLNEPEHHRGTEEVTVDTIDLFCQEHGIQRIDLLKIDVEGFDLEVLKGGDTMLSSGAIRFVLIELGFHLGDNRHTLFDHVRDYLTARDFFLFGIYDQQLEWSGENSLRYANVCFIRES